MTAPNAPAPLAEIIENFEFLDDWDDRYRYLIELGRTLSPMPEAAHNETNRVRGRYLAAEIAARVKPQADPES